MDGQTKINKADYNEIIKPKGSDVTIFRDKAADGSGKYYGKLPSGAVEQIGAGAFEPAYGSFRNQDGQVLSPNGETDLVWDSIEKKNVTHTNGQAEITVTKSGVYEIKVAYGYVIIYEEP